MAVDDIERRLKVSSQAALARAGNQVTHHVTSPPLCLQLLETLPRDMVDASLPSPPASPKPVQRPLASQSSRSQLDERSGSSSSRHRGSDERPSSRAPQGVKSNGSSSRKRKSESQSTRNYDSDEDDDRRRDSGSSSRRKPSPPAK